jgi:hypothetical protein
MVNFVSTNQILYYLNLVSAIIEEVLLAERESVWFY